MTTKPVDGELKYLAGLFEGEGCSCIAKGKSPETKIGYQHKAHLEVNMTDAESVEALHNYFGGILSVRKQNEDTNRRAKYVWRVHNRDASKAAKMLMPHILIPRKRGALQCIIDFAETIADSRNVLDPEVIQKREDLYQKCKAFNARGIGANNRDEADLEAIEAIKTDTAQLNLWA